MTSLGGFSGSDNGLAGLSNCNIGGVDSVFLRILVFNLIGSVHWFAMWGVRNLYWGIGCLRPLGISMDVLDWACEE